MERHRSWRLTAAYVVQDGRLVSTLTEAEARTELAALGPMRGAGTALQRALRRQVGTVHAFHPALAVALYIGDDLIMQQGSPSPPGLRTMLLARFVTMHTA